MAKRKTKKKGVHHRRKKVSGMAPVVEGLVNVGASVVGGLAAAFAIQAGNTAFGAQLANAQWVVPLGTAGAGVGVMYLGHKEKQPALQFLGAGIATVGGVLAANQMGLNVPGISGLAMSNNSGAKVPSLSRAVGSSGMGCSKVGNTNYLNKTVGKYSRLMKVGALIAD